MKTWNEMSGEERYTFLNSQLRKMYGNKFREIVRKKSSWQIRIEYWLLFGF
ncbi:hypothetical protein LCGC14_0494890 [marine sediment metagenome]|uniref:Uncharacterized protein n=1 Tax=marine sediment metagenome TaxID=412755 RepID=A0A0F9SNW2_9ZZZZ